ncbi:MAG TPA: TspO/MBR family protein [Acidimicrobiia bacterium]|nr:TspO/MBR family protein [Acidimicrobiia bacterium]
MQTTDESTDSLTWIKTRSLLVFAAATALVAWLGSMATQESVDSQWFESLQKPGFYPPNQAFGIVWTVLYVMIAFAGWLAWRNGGGLATLRPWTLQLLLNLGWTVVFFGLQEPAWAMVVIVALFAAAAWCAVRMWAVSRAAAWLFVPYIAWIGFAGTLNGAIIALN